MTTEIFDRQMLEVEVLSKIHPIHYPQLTTVSKHFNKWVQIHTPVIKTQEEFKNACKHGHILSIIHSDKSWNWDLGLSYACEGGHMEIVQLMIEKGATDWNWGLQYVCKNGHMEIVQLMIDKGATKCYCCYKSVSEH